MGRPGGRKSPRSILLEEAIVDILDIVLWAYAVVILIAAFSLSGRRL